jgi:sec-independent protein translocase protein TatA
MQMPSFSELLVILGIVALVFGTSRLRTLGGDLGSAIRSFKTAVKDGSDSDPAAAAPSAKVEPPREPARSENERGAG